MGDWDTIRDNGQWKEPEITKISKAQAQAGRQTTKIWLDRVLTTGPSDRPAIEAGLRLAYREACMGQPKVVWVPSPLRGLAMATQLILRGEPTQTDVIFKKEVERAEQAMRQAVNWEVQNVLDREITNKLVDTADDLTRAAALELEIRGAVIEDERPKLGQVIRKLIERAVLGSWEPKVAMLEFGRHALHAIESDHLRGLAEACQAGWWWPFRRVVIVTERPSKIVVDADGRPHSANRAYAIEYPDGFGIYCWHGTRVPYESVTGKPEDIGWVDVETTVDRSVQNALIEIKGKQWSEKRGQKKKPVAVAPAAPPAAPAETPVLTKRDPARAKLEGSAVTAPAPTKINHDDEASERECEEAFSAIKRLGGLQAVRELTESDE